MGLFDGFPFTNMHQLNLDWILRKIGAIDKSVESATSSATSAKTDADRAEATVNTVEELEQSARESANRAAETLENVLPKNLYQHYLTVNVNNNTGTATSQLKAVYDRMEDYSVNFANVNVVKQYNANTLDFSDLSGGIWNVEICRTNNSYGYMLAKKYPNFKVPEKAPAPLVISYMYLYDGIWADVWYSSPTKSSLNLLYAWENVTTNAFAPQEIEISNAQRFDTIVVEFRHSTNYGTSFKLFLKGNGAGCVHYPKSKVGNNNYDETYRYVNRHSGYKLSFQNGYRNGNIDNTAAVPIAVYGLNNT